MDLAKLEGLALLFAFFFPLLNTFALLERFLFLLPYALLILPEFRVPGLFQVEILWTVSCCAARKLKEIRKRDLLHP